MQTVAMSSPTENESPRQSGVHEVARGAISARPGSSGRRGETIRRRGSILQGRALETLGHAVEYLVDSRLFQVEDDNQRAEQEAVQILMRASRAVFAECAEVVSLRTRLRRWLQERLEQEPEVTPNR